MKNIIKYGVYALMFIFIITSCNPQDNDDNKLGPEPTTSELDFSITPSTETPNILNIKNTSSRSGIAVWDLGNYATGKGETIEGVYPFEGEYTITLTLYTSGGSTSITKKVTIANNNFDLLDTEMYNNLTGGFDNVEGKTWIFDSSKEGHLGVFPNDKSWSWNAGPNEKATSSLYKQEFTFSMSKTTGLKLVWKNEGKVYTNTAGRKALAELGYPNATNPVGEENDYDVEYTPKSSYSFTVIETAGLLILTEGAFMGHYAGTSTYRIVNLTENEMELNCSSILEEGNNWRYIFKPKE